MTSPTLTFPAAIACATLALAPAAAVQPHRFTIAIFADATENGTLAFRPRSLASPSPENFGIASGSATLSGSALEVDFVNTLTSLRELRDGWMGKDTLAPPSIAIDELLAAQAAIAPQARISPAADGSIVVEWEAKDREFLVSIENDNTVVFIEEDRDGNLLSESHTTYSAAALQRALRGSGAS